MKLPPVAVAQVLSSAVSAVDSCCSIFAVDLRDVPEAVAEFQLSAPAQLVFFHRGKPLDLDLGRGPVRAMDVALNGRQELLDLLEAVCRGAQQGMHLIVAPRAHGLKWK